MNISGALCYAVTELSKKHSWLSFFFRESRTPNAEI